MLESIKKFDFFQDVEEDALHDILYNLEAHKCEKGQIL